MRILAFAASAVAIIAVVVAGVYSAFMPAGDDPGSRLPARPPREAPRAASAPDSQPFKLEWQVFPGQVEAGDGFTLTVRMYDVQQSGEHGGISVSFPSLNEPGGSNESHSSSVADVDALDYTGGLSNVAFHQPGATIYKSDNVTRFPADYLLVESDDPSWSSSDDRTLRLRITPKQGGDFPIQIRGWLCYDGYTDCERHPSAGDATDQQGHAVELANVSVSAPPAPAPIPAPDSQPFKLEWQTSPTEVEAGDSFTLTVRMYDVQQAGEHGGISVSFPLLNEPGGSNESHSSSVAEVEALDYTGGLSNVAFHQPGATIYKSDNVTRFPAEYLLVESDDPSWSSSDDRTLRLRITPKRGENFPIQIRGWLCADGYTDCARHPSAGNATDQQGHVVEVGMVAVSEKAASQSTAQAGSQTSPTNQQDVSATPPPKVELKRPTLGSKLDQLAELVESGAVSAEEAAQEVLIHRGESVAIIIHISGNVDDVADFLEANGGEPHNVGDDYIEAWAPVTLLGQIADQPGVIRTREIVPSFGNHGEFTSQGADKHGSPAWNQEGYTGKGIKVGIIDVSFEGFSDLMGTELPETVKARCYRDIFYHSSSLENCEKSFVIDKFAKNYSNHGTKVAEAIIDVAPEASLYIANPLTLGDLKNTVEWMIEEEVSVINYSMAQLYDGPGDGTSPDSASPLNSVDRAVRNGIVWVNSAGNEGQTAWFGSYYDPNENGYISFDDTSNVDNRFGLDKGDVIIVQLRWEDKWGGAERDFDLQILHMISEDTGEIVYNTGITILARHFIGSGQDSQKGREGDVPLEKLLYKADKKGVYSVRVVHRNGSKPEWIQLVVSLGVSSIEHFTDGGGINSPSESKNPGLLAVGASPWNSAEVHDSSSRGPTPDGRTKPDIVGATCGVSALASEFCGTSQAAPHVAGLAALVRQRFPDFSPEQVADYLKENAAQMIDSDPNISGHGFAKLPEPDDPTTGAPAPTVPDPAPDSQPFKLDWEVSDTSVEAGDSFTLTVRMYDVQQSGEHGGISVSFPSLNEPGGSNESHSSSAADVDALDYTTGLSKVAFHQPGATIYKSDNVTRFPADYLLVESDDPSWSSSDDRTLRLRITPKSGGDFPIQIRGWLCADGYTDCERNPSAGNATDQQGHVVERTSVAVTGSSVTESAAGRILFSSDRDGDYDIYVMNTDGSDVTRLTDNSASSVTVPRWSPDGRRILFDSDRDGDYDIYVMNADGSGITRLTDNSNWDRDPSWSPDGRRITFMSDRDGDRDIFVMNADGSGVIRLTHSSASDSNPSWSPDGQRIAFNSDRDGDHDIYVMDADGSGITRLTNSSADDADPIWSPDGRRIAFNSDRAGDWDIFVMNADGDGVTRLTDSSADDTDPIWSPDGRRIAFESDRDGDKDIFVMNVDGSGITRLTNSSADDREPSWSPAATAALAPPPPPPPARDDHGDSRFATISAGGIHTCGLLENGEARCWGNNDNGQSTPPDGRFAAISPGLWHTCGLLENGEARCWGNNSVGQSAPPDGRFAAISAGGEHTCGLLENGEARCWGSDYYGESTPPDGRFTVISAGGFHTCGLLENGEARCWGRNSDSQSTPPGGRRFAAISAGSWHTCGLLENGEARCWGNSGYGQSTPPGGRRFAAISAGYLHMCGLLENGEARCWGDNSEGQSTPPDGRFAAISAGGRHTCGLLENGEARCWGNNHDGESTPPGGRSPR